MGQVREVGPGGHPQTPALAGGPDARRQVKTGTRLVLGSCAPGCGACCRVLALPVLSERAARRTRQAVIVSSPAVEDEQWRRFLAARGVRIRGRWLLVPLRGVHPERQRGAQGKLCPDGPEAVRFGSYAGAKAILIANVCQQLDEAGLCRLYGKPERPAVCLGWPTPTDDLSVVAGQCTYRIVEGSDFSLDKLVDEK